MSAATVVIGPWRRQQPIAGYRRLDLEARIAELRRHQDGRYADLEQRCEVIARKQAEIEKLEGQLQ